MAKITRSQADQIVNVFTEISQISEQFPNVFARKDSDDAYYPMATVEYSNGGIQIYVHLDGVMVVMSNVKHCLINTGRLELTGTGGFIRIDISDE